MLQQRGRKRKPGGARAAVTETRGMKYIQQTQSTHHEHRRRRRQLIMRKPCAPREQRERERERE